VVNNLDATALEGDNLIHRLQHAKKRMVLYGDDIWLKLFPSSFMRSDGTSGFFTKDYTQVDDNVTRHIGDELDPTLQHPKSTDWDVLVLHYLGLDHIGHQHGPEAPQMHFKLKEMDDVFARIHHALSKQEVLRYERAVLDGRAVLPTLLVLMSDHGMNQAGNHGGASLSETSAVLGFFHVGIDHRTGIPVCEPQPVRPVCLSVCLSVYLSVCLSVCLSCLLVYLFVCRSIYPSVCLVYLFVSLARSSNCCLCTLTYTCWLSGAVFSRVIG
jgi:hypothetical protein